MTQYSRDTFFPACFRFAHLNMSNFQDLSSSQIVISWVHWVNTYDLKPCIYTQFLCRLECTLLVTIFIVLDPSVTIHLSVWNFYVIGAKCNWKLLDFRTIGVGHWHWTNKLERGVPGRSMVGVVLSWRKTNKGCFWLKLLLSFLTHLTEH